MAVSGCDRYRPDANLYQPIMIGPSQLRVSLDIERLRSIWANRAEHGERSAVALDGPRPD
jgi:hypothetical protein